MINGQSEMKTRILIKEPGVFSRVCFVSEYFMLLLQNENEIQDLGDIIERELRMASSSFLTIV